MCHLTGFMTLHLTHITRVRHCLTLVNFPIGLQTVIDLKDRRQNWSDWFTLLSVSLAFGSTVGVKEVLSWERCLLSGFFFTHPGFLFSLWLLSSLYLTILIPSASHYIFSSLSSFPLPPFFSAYPSPYFTHAVKQRGKVGWTNTFFNLFFIGQSTIRVIATELRSNVSFLETFLTLKL